jgi:RND family efflux transporter MFP subunit
MKMKKVLIPVFLAIILSSSFGCSIFSSSSSSTPQGQVVTVTRGTLETDITPTGNLLMPHQVKLNFGSSGTVDEIDVQMGDTVKQGQVLAKLDTVPLEADLIQAQINVKTAQMNLERAETPTTNSSGTTVISAPDPLDIEIKQFQLDQTKLKLQDAQNLLTDATMVAPFDGWIAEVNVAAGDIVSADTVIIRIVDPTQLEVDVLVNEMDINSVKVGSPATVQITAIPGMNLSATAVAISPAATTSGGVVNYMVKLEVQPPKAGGTSFGRGQAASATSSGSVTSTGPIASTDSTATGEQKPSVSIPVIREGMSVTVSIITAQSKNALMLPNRAVTRQGRDTVVQVVNDAGETEQRTISTGISNWQYVEVTSGLDEGDKVLVPETSSTSSQSSTSTTTQQPGQNRMFRPGGILR